MNRGRNVIIGILVSLYMFHEVPALSLLFPSSFFAIVVVFTFFYLVFCVGMSKFFQLIPFFIIPFLNFVTGIWSDMVHAVATFMQVMILPMTALYIVKTGNKKMGKVLLVIFVVLQIITCITTCMGLIRFPNASRMQAVGGASETPEYMLYRSLNIGGFDFIYTLVVSFPIIIFSWMSRKDLSKGRKGLILNVIIMSIMLIAFWTILQSQYTTALVLTIFSFFLLFIRTKASIRKLVIILIIGTIFFSMLKPVVGAGFIFASRQVQSELVQLRLYDIGLSLQGRSTQSDDYDERNGLWRKSWTTFTEHPFGTWGGGTGAHSAWLDSLALYGIIGLIAIVILIYSVYNYLILPLADWKLNNCAIFVFGLFFGTALLNPHIYTNVLLFIMPLFFYSYFDVRLLCGMSRSAR